MISDRIRITLLSGAVSFLVSVGAVYLYDAYFVQKFVVFDVASYLDKQKTEFLAGRMDEEKLREEFAKAKAIIDVLGENRIVLSKDMVLSGGRDITDEISKYSKK